MKKALRRLRLMLRRRPDVGDIRDANIVAFISGDGLISAESPFGTVAVGPRTWNVIPIVVRPGGRIEDIDITSHDEPLDWPKGAE